ncbi:MAG: carbohydrate binding domain-containing protein [Anaerolineae bacterium]
MVKQRFLNSAVSVLGRLGLVSLAATLLLSGIAHVAAQSGVVTQSVYSDALESGWKNWSWETTVNLGATNPVHSGTKSLAATYNNAWAGVYLRLDAPESPGFDTLRFWINGGSGGQKIAVYFIDQNNGFTLGAVIRPQANTWTQVDVPMAPFGSSDNLWGLVWQENNGSAQAPFYLDDIQLLGSGVLPPSQEPQTGPTLTVNTAAGQHPISPYIYGMNFGDPALAVEIRLPVNRWGGNATTRYNWQADATNHASDWYFEASPNPTATRVRYPMVRCLISL